MVTHGTRKINIVRFLDLAETIPVADVRSPSEYLAGHIPGAINLPLFNDREREIVGTIYKKEGRLSAVYEGLNLTASSMSEKLEKGITLANKDRLLVHCWRGGMRSEAMAWLFSLGNIHTAILEGGYKSYRKYILESLSEKRKMIVLGGMTGSGKTQILRKLKENGEQIIDLEGLANHKGSAFGSLGQPPQPSTEQFANNLFFEWNKIKRESPFWIEDESRNIGTIFIPDNLYLNMQDTYAVILMMDVNTRLPRLIEEYSGYSAEALKTSIIKISKRLGGDNTRDALKAVESGDIAKAIELSLNYYDKAYKYGLTKKNPRNIIYIKTDTEDIETNSLKIINATRNIVW